jgi:hypothetical protein
MWIGGFGIGISVGSNIAKRRIKHHIDQESVRQVMRYWRTYVFFGWCLLSVLGAFYVGCAENLTTQPEHVPNPAHTIKRLATDGNRLSIFEIDNCQYIVMSTTLIHKANCPNHTGSFMGGAKP